MAAPRKHPPKDAAEVIERLAAQGHTLIGIAKHFKVVRSTVKRWLDENETLAESFEMGKETERQALHALIVQSAAQNKAANVNAFFILKARHGYRENDAPNTKIDVGVAIAQPVLVVRDHGSDQDWAAKCAAQQERLTQGDNPRTLPAASVCASQPSPEAALWLTTGEELIEAPAAASSAGPPVWRHGR